MNLNRESTAQIKTINDLKLHNVSKERGHKLGVYLVMKGSHV